jgi:UDP-3-O-[3-hydroxymyristoyl] glucosamine N-acyltransferase
VEVGPFCVIGPDVRIGRGSIIRSGVRIFPRVSIGEECHIYPNCVIGNDSYAYVRNEQGNKTRMPHLGGLIIGSHVDIGACSTVYVGKIAPTIIEDYAKIGDLVVVAHNTRIGKNAGLSASSVLSGSAVVEADAWIGVNATIRDGLRVGAHALVGMDVSLQSDLPDKTIARAPRPDVKPRPDDDDLTAIGFTGRS